MNHDAEQALNTSLFPRRRGNNASNPARSILGRSALGLALLMIAACGTSPKVSFYTLDASPPPLAKAAATAPYHVAIGPVSVPEILDRPQIVTRASPNQVTMNEYERWAEPLKSAIPRLIANQLEQMLPARISVYPQEATDKAMRLSLTLQHFESEPGEAATVELQWTLRGAKDDEPHSGRARVREEVTGRGYEALVAAHTRALTRISAEIAESIRKTRQ